MGVVLLVGCTGLGDDLGHLLADPLLGLGRPGPAGGSLRSPSSAPLLEWPWSLAELHGGCYLSLGRSVLRESGSMLLTHLGYHLFFLPTRSIAL